MPTYEPSSSVSAKFRDVDHASTTSKTIPALIPLDRSRVVRIVSGWVWSLAAKPLLAVIFVLVLAFIYVEFRSVHQDSQSQRRSVRDEGRVISQSLLPLLEAADSAACRNLAAILPALPAR